MADREPQRALWRVGTAASVACAGYLVAEMADLPFFGAFSWTFAVALVAGVAFGALWARRTTTRWSVTLRSSWTTWNQAAIGAGSVAETAARVEGRRLGRGLAGSAALGTLLVVNGALAIAAWSTLPPADPAHVYGAFAFAVTAATGTFCGAYAARAMVAAAWARGVARATMELVQEGRLGVWGVR